MMVEILRGTPGRIYTVCDGRGVEVKGVREREAPQRETHLSLHST